MFFFFFTCSEQADNEKLLAARGDAPLGPPQPGDACASDNKPGGICGAVHDCSRMVHGGFDGVCGHGMVCCYPNAAQPATTTTQAPATPMSIATPQADPNCPPDGSFLEMEESIEAPVKSVSIPGLSGLVVPTVLPLTATSIHLTPFQLQVCKLHSLRRASIARALARTKKSDTIPSKLNVIKQAAMKVAAAPKKASVTAAARRFALQP